MAKDKLQYIIDSVFNPKGFDSLGKAVGKAKQESKGFSSILNSGLGRMATGYLTLTGLTNQYNKMVEASNYQLEQETKLYATMSGQGFREEQIDSIKQYASALQEIGVVGDEVTLAGVQQLATYNLTEESLKKLMPAMQDMLVQQKGLNGTGQDAIGVANIMAKGLLGQTGRLEQVGISLTDYQKQLIATGTEEEKVAALVEAVTMNVGEQNKEFLKLPEGRITSAKNRIGDMYEYWGGLMRETRADVWDLFSDNSGIFGDFVTGIIKTGTKFADTTLKTIKVMRQGFGAMGDDAKKVIGVVSAGFLSVKFPMVALAFAIEDVFGAFQGKESFTEDAINALLEFTGTDYKFKDLRKDVTDFWGAFIDPTSDVKDEISTINFALQNTVDILKTGVDTAQIFLGAAGLSRAIPAYLKDLITSGFDFEEANENFENSFAWKNMKGGYDSLNKTTDHMAYNMGRNKKYHERRAGQYSVEPLEQGSTGAKVMEKLNARNAPVKFNFTNTFVVNESKDGKKIAEEAAENIKKVMEESINGEYLRIGGAAYEY